MMSNSTLKVRKCNCFAYLQLGRMLNITVWILQYS